MKVKGYEIFQCDAGWRIFSFLKVMTDEGIVGWSEYNESFGSHGLSGVIEALLPVVIGKDPRDIELINAMLATTVVQSRGGINAPGRGGHRERAARHQGQGARRAGLRSLRRRGAQAHSRLLVALRQLSRALSGLLGVPGVASYDDLSRSPKK